MPLQPHWYSFYNCGTIGKIYGLAFELNFKCVEYALDKVVRGVDGKKNKNHKLVFIYTFWSHWNILYIYYTRCIYFEVIWVLKKLSDEGTEKSRRWS